MNLVNQLFEIPLLFGIIFLVAGFISYGFPPQKINYLYGYRTSNSMKNPEVWTFSQKYASIKMIQSGFLIVSASFASFLFDLNENQNLILGMSLLLTTIILILYCTEKAIKTKFPNF